MAQFQEDRRPRGQGRDVAPTRPPTPPPGWPPPDPSGSMTQPTRMVSLAHPPATQHGMVPVEPLGHGQEPAGARLSEGQLSPDGRYVWQRGEWLPRLPAWNHNGASALHLSADRYLHPPDLSAELGFRGFLHRRLGLKVPPAAAERRRRHLLQATRTEADGPRLIVVASQKGGVGKSTLAMLLGSQFSVARKDRVLVLDSNPDSSSLAIRAAHRTTAGATDLAPYADRVVSYAQLQPYVTVMAGTGLEVLPSLPERGSLVGEGAARALAGMASRFFAVIIADLGTGVAGSGWWLANAHQVVVVATPSLDGAFLAQSTLGRLERRRGPDWVRENAIVVMNQAGLADRRIKVDAQERDLRSHVRQVFRLGWDPHLATGGAIDWEQVAPELRRQTLQVAADLGANFKPAGATDA